MLQTLAPRPSSYPYRPHAAALADRNVSGRPSASLFAPEN